jgi:nucleoside 2-deoxyribosyltransferase
MSLIYLASPYSHPDPIVREERFKAVCRKSAELLTNGKNVFSPIAHSHPIQVYGDLPKADWEFWRAFDFEILAKCDVLYVLKLPGWSESRGVLAEIEEAARCRINVLFLNP